MAVGILWVILRLLISLFALIFSSLKPMTMLEKSLPAWPILLTNNWFSRVFLDPLIRWDVQWYIRIVSQGYQPADGTAQFHPAFPLLASLFASLGLNPALSLMLVSSGACMLFFYQFRQLALTELSIEETQQSLILMAFWPMSFILFVPYTEALFAVFSASCLLFCHKRYWLWAGLAGAGAVLTRQQGILLLLPLAWGLWKASDQNIRFAWKNRWQWFFLSFIPLAYLAWIGYRGLILNDFHWNLTHPEDIITKLLVSPSAVEVVEYKILWPWQTLDFAFRKLITAPDVDIWTNLLFGCAFLLVSILSWKFLKPIYRGYVAAILLISMTFYTGPVHPLMGFVRHMWLAFPVFIGLVKVIDRPWKRLIYSSIGFIAMIFLLCLYSFEAWVP